MYWDRRRFFEDYFFFQVGAITFRPFLVRGRESGVLPYPLSFSFLELFKTRRHMMSATCALPGL